MITENHWMWGSAVALILFAILSPIVAMEIFDSKTDYQYCLDKCAKKFNGDYIDRECPRNCLEVLKFTKHEKEPNIPKMIRDKIKYEPLPDFLEGLDDEQNIDGHGGEKDGN